MLQSAIYRGLYTVITFIAGIIIANILLPSDWGNLSLFIINAAIISVVTGLGVDGIMVHSLTNHKWNIKEALYFFWATAIFQIFLFLIIEGIFISVQGKTILSLDGETPVFLEAFYFVGLILTERYTSLFYSLDKSRIANILLLVQAILFFLLLLFIKKQFNISYYTILYIICLQTFIQGILLASIFHIWVQKPLYQQIPWKFFFNALKLSLVVMVTNFIQFIAYRIDFYLLKKYHSEFEVGIYAQANKFANLMWIVPGILAFLIMSKLKRIDKEKMPALFKVAIFINMLILIATIFITNIIYAYFLHPSYSLGLKPFYLMLPGYFLFSLVLYLSAYCSWLGKFQYNLLGSSICLIIILIADLILIPAYSIRGAAISNTIAYSFVFLFYLFIINRKFAYKFWKFNLPQKKDFHFLLNQLK